MTITITIEADNAAFDGPDERTAEVARILTNYAREIVDTCAVLCPGDEARLYDYNGNRVGAVHITGEILA